MHLSQIFNGANMSFTPFRENKILAKISEFTITPDEMAHEVGV